MRHFLLIIAIFGITATLAVQQVPLKGVVTVQNSKTHTGKTQFVKNAEIEHTNLNNAKTKDVTGDDGKFLLNIKGVSTNTQTQIAIVLHGDYRDYVVVNEKELRDITLGRLTPVSVYICKKGDLEQRQAEMVGINMRKLEERLEKDKNRLQKELNELRAKSDYLNVRYSEIKDSLDLISRNIDNAFERIKEYAKTMTLENLDDRDENYIKAYKCFSRGELDSVSYYLRDDDLNLKYEKIVQLQQEARKEKELAAILTESAKQKEEFTENSLNELIKEWLLLARTYDMKYDYEKTMAYYEKIIQADPLNVNYTLEYADYLYKINEYVKAEIYYRECLEAYRELAAENPNYLSSVAIVLNDLGLLHRNTKEYTKSMQEFEEALKIRRELAKGDAEEQLSNVAALLSNMAGVHYRNKEYSEAQRVYEEALKIYRELPIENLKANLDDMAAALNGLALLQHDNDEYLQAQSNFEEALHIYRELAAENPKLFLSKVALVLNNLALVNKDINEYSKALKECEEALLILRDFVKENPKVYLSELARTLMNLAILHADVNEHAMALNGYEESLNIYRELAIENPTVYLSMVAMSLNNIATVLLKINEHQNAIIHLEESLKIRRELAADNPKVYLSDVALTLFNLAFSYYEMKEHSKALPIYEESLKIYVELAAENPDIFASDVEEVKDYISEIKEILQED
jgi:tetratricopeptide (TPR) repeat protein